jgi:hypothetical protein
MSSVNNQLVINDELAMPMAPKPSSNYRFDRFMLVFIVWFILMGICFIVEISLFLMSDADKLDKMYKDMSKAYWAINAIMCTLSLFAYWIPELNFNSNKIKPM